MNTMSKVVKVLCKVVEILMWMGDAAMVGLTIAYIIMGDSMITGDRLGSNTLEINGLSVNVVAADGAIYGNAIITTFITGAIVLGLAAMIFRNCYLIFKTSEGATKYSIGATPFQPENVRMIREIGIFSIAIPVVEFFASVIINIMLGNNAEVSISAMGLLYGFIILCLSQYFAQGAKLQEEVDGLL